MEPESWIAAAGVVLAAVVLPRLLGGPRAPREVVARKIAEGATIVDVRSPAEFAAGAYPRAVNIPLGALRSRLAELPKEGAVIVYCASGVRSGAAARLLRRAGHAEVLNAGGLRQLPW